jgi:Mn2+/Fe2+ NRAMP family transporter
MSDNKDEPRVRGLGHMAADPQALARERQTLEALAKESAGKRFRGYFALTGPGWLQSAFTLGGGSAVASLYLGAHYGYELMWVQPLAMTVGIIMLAACAHQTLSTGVRPFAAMSRFIHPGVAWAWALATLVSSWVFHFPQYSLAAGVTEDITTLVTGWSPQGAVRTAFLLAIGVVILAVSTAITWNYGRGIRGIRLYERTLKAFIAMIIIAFGLVVARGAASGTIDWGALARGFIPTSIPSDAQGVTTVMGAFGAAVGINMTFLFGYSLLARGWGTSHRGLARFDLVTGMLLPYAVVTSLIIIAAASTIYGTEFAPQQILPANAGMLIGSSGVGEFTGRVVFALGILGMALSTITLQMIVAGFVVCELFGWDAQGPRFRWACLVPAPAMAGVVLWETMGTWVALPAFTIGLIMLPIAYVSWFVLQNSEGLLGEHRPRGASAVRWNIAMSVAVAVTLVSVAYTLWTRFLS